MRMALNVLGGLALFILGAMLGSASMVIYRHSDELVQIYRHGFNDLVRLVSPAENRNVLYYRDPSGAPYWSAAPKKDSSGRDYIPVYEDEEKLNLGEETSTN
jgi:Cu(I)/Ag(I) efflux system membrane fusion protein